MINHLSDKTVASIGAGCVATACGHPLDLLRTRLLFGNAAPIARNMNKGITFTLGLSVLKSGAIWPIQAEILKKIEAHQIEGFPAVILSGGIGNVIPNLILAPFNHIRVHLIRDNTAQSVYEVSKKIYKNGGFTRFYVGMPVTILRDSIWGTIYFPTVSYFRKKFISLNPDTSKTSIDFKASICAAIISTSATSIIDAFRLHQMNGDKAGYTTYWNTFKRAIQPTRSNFLATATGVTRVAITTAISHTLFNYFMRMQSNP